MIILNTRSLISTIDALNEAVLRRLPWEDEAERLSAWLADRLGKPGGYAGSFALTEGDWNREFRLFTGERITTKVARAHIIAEEAIRALAIIHRVTGRECPALTESAASLADRIFHHEGSTVVQDGIYCCGRCSAAFWRCMAAGGYGPQQQTLSQGLSSLARHRDGHGGWRRFPFYYTLALLGEIDPGLAAAEIRYCSPRFSDLRRLLVRKTDRYSFRRLQIINRLAV